MPRDDIWRTASLLIDQYGIEAALVAAARADELLVAGDPAGHARWKEIVMAIVTWQEAKPKLDGAIN